MAMAENVFNKFNEFIRDVRNDEIKSIVFGLFALIGFIILVYSIFTGIVREPLASVADTVFVAAIIGVFYFGRNNYWEEIVKQIIFYL
jgi:hypothetical protein